AVSGNTAGLVGNVTYVAGKAGQAFCFDGNSAAIQVGNPPMLQLQDFTIETWVKRTDSSRVSLVTGQDGLVFSYIPHGYGFGLDPSGQLFLSRIGTDKVTSNSGITDTNFHHVAVTKSGTNVVFFLDGASFPAAPYLTTFAFTTSAAIGARGDDFRNSFLGCID